MSLKAVRSDDQYVTLDSKEIDKAAIVLSDRAFKFYVLVLSRWSKDPSTSTNMVAVGDADRSLINEINAQELVLRFQWYVEPMLRGEQ